MQGNKVQLSIVSKNKLPLTIGVQSEYIFDITLKGKYVIILVHVSNLTTINHSEVAWEFWGAKAPLHIDCVDLRILSRLINK